MRIEFRNQTYRLIEAVKVVPSQFKTLVAREFNRNGDCLEIFENAQGGLFYRITGETKAETGFLILAETPDNVLAHGLVGVIRELPR